MHLRAPDINRYLGRDLDERTLTAMDAQLSVSLPWTQVVAQRAMEEADWERRGFLGRLVRVDRRGEAREASTPPERAKAA